MLATVPIPQLRRANSLRLTTGFAPLSSIQGRIEPAVLVAFIQYGLQRRETCRHGQDPDPGPLRQQSEPHRLALQQRLGVVRLGHANTFAMMCRRSAGPPTTEFNVAAVGLLGDKRSDRTSALKPPGINQTPPGAT
jgi:hypothetical protein